MTVNSGVSTATTAEETQAQTEERDLEPVSAPTGLEVDYEPAPNNLRPDATPRFTWHVRTNSRDRSQRAYRVLVSRDKSTLTSDTGDVWDSGRVAQATSSTIDYRGPALDPDTTYHWKVRIWDSQEQATAWSEPGSFTTAKSADPADWTGSWIGVDSSVDSGLVGTDWTDYVFESTVTIENAATGFVFRAQDTDNCYMWQLVLASSPDADGDEHVLRPHVRENGAWTRLGNFSVDSVLRGTEHDPHDVRIDVAGDTITTYIDDTKVDERQDSTHSSGTIGFREYNTEHARIDNVSVVSQDDEVHFEADFEGPVLTSFTGGTLSNGALDLSGTGIVLHTNRSLDPSPLLRTEFTADKPIADARVHVAGIGYSELYLNGERVGDDVLNPAWTLYEDRVVYSTYDVTDLVTEGTNAAGIWLGKGWFSKNTPWYMSWESRGPPRALLDLTVTYADGSTETVVTDDTWQTHQSPLLENDIYDGETYDARREQTGWAEPGFDGDWSPVDALNAPGEDFILQPQRTQPIRAVDTLEPQTIESHDGGYVVDFGQNHSGWVELQVQGASEGDEIVLKHAEVRNENGDLVMKDLRGADSTDRYVARGDDVETYEPRFTYHGYRYVEVRGYPGELTADDLVSKVVHTDKPRTGSFTCSNEDLNQVQHNAVWGMQSNSHSIPTDCPQRDERLGWTGDAHMTGRSSMYNFDAARFNEKWMRDHDDDQSPEGYQSDTIPSAVGDGDADPNWAKTRVTVAWYLYAHTGDEQVLRDRYKGLKAYVDYWRGEADGYIIPAHKQHYGDWLAFEDTPDAALLNTFAYHQSTQLFARIADELDRDGDAATYHALADDIASAFNDAFFDERNAVYGSGSQTTYAVPLFAGIVPDKHEQRVADNLATKVKTEDDGKLQTGFIGTRPLLFSLVEYGHEKLAYHVVSQPEQPGWVYMVRNGATTMWERWDSDERIGSGMNSFNHRPWAEISEWFFRVLAGIDIESPGFEEIEIKPRLVDDLDWAEGSVETVRGEVASRWERSDRGVELSVTIPWNTTATVYVPAEYTDAVTENGDALTDATGVTFDRMEDGYAVLSVGSGTYTLLSDPVRGGTGFANRVAKRTQQSVDNLQASGKLSDAQAHHLDTNLANLVEQTANALSAREITDRTHTIQYVQNALTTVNSLRDWVASKRAAGSLTADTASVLTDDLIAIDAALSHASTSVLDVDATATLQQSALVAGGRGTVDLTLLNEGAGQLYDARVDVNVPEEWTVTPTTTTHSKAIPVDESFTATFDVDVPLSQARTKVPIMGTATYRHRGGVAEIPVETIAKVGSPVTIERVTAPPAAAGDQTTLSVMLANTADETVTGDLSVTLPDGWTVDRGTKHYSVPAESETTVTFTVTAPEDAEHGVQAALTATYGDNFADSASTGIFLGPVASWEFDTAGDPEGWEPWNDITDFTVTDGTLSYRSTGGDPYMGQTDPLSIDAPNGLSIQIRMKTSVNSGGQVFWTTADAPVWSEGKSKTFDVTGGEWQTYTIDMPPQDSSVTGLRLDAVRETATIEIDYIRVYF
ncbi:alpha-L-rhamnosidase [Natrinema gelatinilyticum]|uniref:alpha-L-rhamnosidase n=1 Tax=Natrinema gelatinilyticum TaxID=2961571 RepID=UPI0020C297F1|nr:family 78 glycoside hydrolase catalytic domain [Natrinema gelatinilyticum]